MTRSKWSGERMMTTMSKVSGRGFIQQQIIGCERNWNCWRKISTSSNETTNQHESQGIWAVKCNTQIWIA